MKYSAPVWGSDFGWKAYWESNTELFHILRMCQQSAGRAPLQSCTLAFDLQLRKITENLS
jgi:hypothetical protein